MMSSLLDFSSIYLMIKQSRIKLGRNMHKTLVVLLLTSSGFFKDDEVTFSLFTPESPKSYARINNYNVVIDRNESVVFLVHGWLSGRWNVWYEQVTNAFLARGTYVIQVDWSKPAAQVYPAAVTDSKRVGQLIGKLIINSNIFIERIHICGHSLGGQIAGFVGKYLQVFSLTLSRITALDPAGLLFEGFLIPLNSRLSRYDAQIVVVIHTDDWKFGFRGSCGSVDIYPNGGAAVQPGCPDSWDGWFWCSHSRSYQFYIDALENPGTLMGTLCWNYEAFKDGSCTGRTVKDLGGDFGMEDQGEYYLITNARKPYGKR